ncbi:MAG: HAD-IIA family hydrolase [Candidatus Aminicenantes bacterium]|nr:HAD-IIA family hydrolase [Candidatus Aminicenantes bacterium]
MTNPLQSKKVVFLDLDGTIYLGNRLIEGAQKFLKYLESSGIQYYFLSNNSSRSKQDYVQKLSGLGIQTSQNRILLSTDGVIDFLVRNQVKDTYVVGTRSMKEMFKKQGIETNSPCPKYVVLGFDTELVYEKLKKAALFLLDEIPLLATHPDMVCPTPEGPIPDIGSMLALFEKATGKKALKIFGKPNVEMVQHLMKKHHASPREVAMIGDRIYTDMELSNRLNCDFFLVLSGETSPQEAARLPKKPALVAENIGQIIPSA